MTARRRPSAIDRRRFLEYTWRGVGASLSLALVSGHEPDAPGRGFGDNPFTLGVASGDPTSGRDRVVDPSRAGPGRSGQPGQVARFRSAGVSRRDSRMRHVVARGMAVASRRARTLGARRGGRACCRADDYFYQFDVRGEESASATSERRPRPTSGCARSGSPSRPARTGRAATTPRTATCCRTISIWCSTSATTPTSTASTRPRAVAFPPPEGFEEETVDLRTYRLRHTLYKLDPDLQAVHARFPFVVIWDDHEVAERLFGSGARVRISPSPEFTARRAAAYQAYYEHMPIRLRSRSQPAPGLRIYRRLRYGPAGRVHDARRSAVPDGQPVRRRRSAALRRGADRRLQRCSARQQERWVARGFERLVGALEHRRAAAAHRPTRARDDHSRTGSGTTPGTATRSRASGS